MPELIVIVPSRGRPLATKEFGRAYQDTRTANTQVVFAVDADDPTVDDYDRERLPGDALIICDGPSTMVHTLNFAAQRVLEMGRPNAIAFMGDDHRPRTKGWDRAYLDALRLTPGLVYGDDLIQGMRLPTQVAISADVVRALGHMAPPPLTHMYVDNYWLDLGRAAGCLTYLPEVVIEHCHPAVGKAEWDEGYERVNDQTMYDRDAVAYEAYWNEFGARDVAAVRAAAVPHG